MEEMERQSARCDFLGKLKKSESEKEKVMWNLENIGETKKPQSLLG